MQLTRKQRRQIEKLAKINTPEEIARTLNLSKDIVLGHLPAKIKNQIEKSPVNFDVNFKFKTWVKDNYLIFILLAFLAIVTYANGLNNDFLSDDLPTLAQNQLLGTTKFIFSRPFIFLRGFIYSAIFWIAGRSQVAFRFSNVLFHIGATLVFYFLISKTVSKKIAIFSTTIYSVHPIISESITWVSGGYYPQYGFFLLLTLALYISSKKNDKWYTLSLVSFIFTLLSSERTVYFPGIIFFWEICFGNIKANWKRILPYIFLSGLWGIFFIYGALQQRVSILQTDYYQKQTSQNPLFQIPVAISSYFWLIIWPKALTLYHSEMNFTKINFALRFIVTVAYFASLVYFYIKQKVVFFWLLFFFITLTPFLTPLGISWVVAERYVYLGSMGIIIIIGMLLNKILKFKNNEIVFYVITALLVVSLSVRTIYRNIDWKNQDNLWLSADKYSPSSPQNHNNLGDLYARHGDLDKSIEEFKQATFLQTNYADAFHNLANVYVQKGDYKNAKDNYQKAIYFNPNLWQSHQNLGSIYFQEKNFSKAEEEFNKALQVNPQNSNLHYALGIVFATQNKKEAAINEFRNALQLNPNDQQSQAALQQLIQ